jgi:threonine efflux protein
MKLLFSICALHTMALMTPGPDLFLTLKNTLQFGKKSGIISAIGFGLGILCHCVFSSLSVFFLVSIFSEIKLLLTYLGALYLLWLSLSSWYHTYYHFKESQFDANLHSGSKKLILTLGEAFFTNLLNPKAALFIFGLISSLTIKNLKAVSSITIGICLFLLTILWFSMIATIFDNPKIRLSYFKFEKNINYLFSLIFFLFAISLILNQSL